MTALANITLQNKLVQIIKQTPGTLKAAVAKQALASNYIHLADFFNDMLNDRAKSSTLKSLVAYCDALFFDTHYHEIEEIRIHHELETGKTLAIYSDLKETLAWFAFEKTIVQLAIKLGLS